MFEEWVEFDRILWGIAGGLRLVENKLITFISF